VDLRTRRVLRKLVALQGSDNEKERASAWRRIDEILKRHKQTWGELPELIGAIPDDDPQPASPSANDRADAIGALDLVEGMLRRYVGLKEHEYVVPLWAVHTHVYDQFSITPRLALTSPTSDCGKSTLLLFLKAICASPHKSDDVTPASLFRLIDAGFTTLLCDEIDNADLANNRVFRAIANGGHHRSGAIVRTIDGQPRSFSTFSPMALAAIGAVSLPLPLRRRSVSIHMERADDASVLTRFDENEDRLPLIVVHQTIVTWASAAQLAREPAMPTGLRDRAADNWRVLLSIADAYGRGWGERAREAALIMARGYRDEDIAVTLLRHIRDTFEAYSVDRIASVLLVAALCDLEDAPWAEWRGVKDDQPPRKLTQRPWRSF
jgi:putative DNA primase/helicase